MSVVFSPDSKTLASGSNDHTVRLWDVGTGRMLHVCSGHKGFVRSVAWSPDGSMIASGSYDATTRLWQVEQPMFWWVCPAAIGKKSRWSMLTVPSGWQVRHFGFW